MVQVIFLYVGGHDSDESDLDCKIYNILVFDGGDANDQIIQNNSTTVKISHENFSETRSEHLLAFSNLDIIRDDEWQAQNTPISNTRKKESLFSTSVKNALIDSQFALSKAKNCYRTR